MKAKQIKKLLSITLASAMVVSGEPGIPAIVMAEEETQSEVKNGLIAEGEAADAENTSEMKTTAETDEAAVSASETVTEEKTEETSPEEAENAGTEPSIGADTNSETDPDAEPEISADTDLVQEQETTTDTVQEEPQSPAVIEEVSIEEETDAPEESDAEAESSQTVTVTWANKTVTYNAEPQSLDAPVVSGDYIGSYHIVYTDENGQEVKEPKDAGTYTADVIFDDQDCTVTGEKGKLVIEKLHVNVKIADLEIIHWWGGVGSEDYEILDSEQGLPVSYRVDMEFRNEHPWLLDYGNDGNVGVFDITIRDEVGAESKNFIIDNRDMATGKFTVKKCPLYVEIPDQTKMYGEEDNLQYKLYVWYKNLTGEPGFYEHPSSFITDILQREPGEAVCDQNGNKASYQITLNQTELKNFYFVDRDGNPLADTQSGPIGTLTINPLPISITIPDMEKVYGDADPDLSIANTDIGIDSEGHNVKKSVDDVKVELTGANVALKRESGEAVNGEGKSYEISLSGMENASNYVLKNEKKGSLTIKKAAVKVSAQNVETVYGQVPELSYDLDLTGTGLKKEQVKKELPENLLVVEDEDGNILDEQEAAKKNVGEYKIVLNPEVENENYTIDFTPAVLKISQLPVAVSPKAGQTKVYGEDDPEHYQYEVSVDGTGTTLDKEDVVKELEDEFVAKGQEILQREAGDDVSKEGYEYSLAADGKDYGNFQLTLVGEEVFYIQPLDITVKANPQSKVYGAADPKLADAYDLVIPENSRVAEEDIRGDLERLEGDTLTRAGVNEDDGNVPSSDEKDAPDISDEDTDASDGDDDENGDMNDNDADIDLDSVENVGLYDIELNKTKVEALTNYNITYEKAQLEIVPLPLTVTPVSAQKKIYGEDNPDFYDYDISYSKENSGTQLEKDEIIQELGDLVLVREDGELPGTYAYKVNDSDSYKAHLRNYQITLKEDGFVIDPLEIVSVDFVNSRQGSFTVKTNLKDRAEDAKTAFKITAEFPKSEDITFDRNIDNYITDASKGISFTSSSGTVKINTAAYTKTGKNKEKLEWNGKLPAGTRLTITVVDEKGNVVSNSPVTVEVQKANAAFSWNGLKKDANGAYVDEDGSFSLKADSGKNSDELTEIVYKTGEESTTSVSYHKNMNVKFSPKLSRKNGTDLKQSVTANVVDTLNINCDSKTQTFYVKGKPEAVTPAPTQAPQKTPAPTETPKPTEAPKPTEVPKPTKAPKPTEAVKPSVTPNPANTETNSNAETTCQQVKYGAYVASSEVTSYINPLGKYFFDKKKKDGERYAATPVSYEDFQDSDKLEIPLIMGMKYEVGKLVIKKTEDGIVITSKLELSLSISRNDYKVKKEKLYIYRSEPTFDDLKNRKGEEFLYDDIIPLKEGETIWLVDEKDITIQEKDMKKLKLFDFEKSKEYKAYQKIK